MYWELKITDLKLRKHCISCGKGEMENTGRPLPQHEDVFYCKCKECGYIDASFLYENLNHLTTSNPLRAGKNEQTDGI